MMQQVVDIQSVTKLFDKHAALKDVTLAADAGDVIGLLGKNGAGKTTLLEVLLGFSPPSAGQSYVFGASSMELPNNAKARIGFTPQQDELVQLFSARQQLELIASFYANWDRELVDRLLRSWEVPLDRQIDKMSVGERQKLSAVLAMGHCPDLLVLDEPVASLDPIARRKLLREIIDISSSGERTVLFSTHIVSDLERVANKVWILKEGRIAWQGDIDALKESVVRLHIHGRSELPNVIYLPGGHSGRVHNNRASIVVTHWQPDQLEELRKKLDAEIEVESLSLEDIFMELHA